MEDSLPAEPEATEAGVLKSEGILRQIQSEVFCECCGHFFHWEGESLQDRPECPQCGSWNTTPTNVMKVSEKRKERDAGTSSAV